MASPFSHDTPLAPGSVGSGTLTVRRPITVMLAAAMALGVFAPVCAVVVLMYSTATDGADQITVTAKEELATQIFSKLEAMRDNKKVQIEEYFAAIARDIESQASNPTVRDAFLELDAAAAAAEIMGLEGEEILKDTQYRPLHDKYAVSLGAYVEKYGYDDVLFACSEHGDISFTTAGSGELGARASEDMPDSPLAVAWRRAVETGATALSDVRPHEPAGGVPCQFVATPIQEDDTIIGVLLFRISPTRVNTIMTMRAGMQETGELYVVGPDKLMRSDSHLDPENRSVFASFSDHAKGSVDTEAVNAALKGKTNAKTIVDYRGVSVLSAYTPVEMFDIRWALVAEIDEAEAFAAIDQVQQIHDSTIASLAAWAAGLSVLCLLAITAVGLGVHWKIARPIRNMARAATAVANGDLGVRVPAEGKSETGVLARVMNQMTTNLSEIVQQIATAAAEMEVASAQQASGAAHQSTATAEMSTTAGELLTVARQMTESGTSVSEQAELATRECVEGTKSIQDAVQGIVGIRERVEKIAEHMLGLNSKSQQISGVLDIINELSEQTNLLSLNASIEAAGAGEAGKRFAVVASEIRKLAERAAESTTEIRGLIDSIQETVNTTSMATEEGTKAVEHGMRQTGQLEGSFERIATQVASTTQSAKAIELASRQQTRAIEQVDEAVRNIDTTAKQSEVSARQVQTEAQRLAEAARRFTTSGAA